MAANDVLTRDQIDTELAALPDWTLGLGALRTVLKCPTSASALDLFAAIGALAQTANHHPDVDWRYDHLFVTLTSHDAGSKVSARDTSLAGAISARAKEAGAVARPELLHTVEIAIDTDDADAIADTWQTALGYRTAADGALVDPFGRGPSVWFQKTSTPNDNRFHLDVTVPYSQSARTLSGLESAGASLDHGAAPRFVVATDVQGNRLCVCTEKGRDA
ncbi:4a-hydroxytetrahydrobiopterin dehydratase [Arthrobacter sp. PAMC 25486]|uniref:4a-hydroxytetrahydrobiopterin dehydratase n=1 Tax=Arthrobacter sp. PAMC 25486 TaxID=1494608 RepID=UPI000535C70D|nr:4a-hydroxytetrahydrobiopterin dehydratase [Arthrobacter sp. PAMC 25486]AIY01418.1 4a-hydroxytetrahydrobiopterin dehydratase [Arthrobacter sp. PAMC 25486]